MLASATTNPFVVVNLLADGRHLGYAVADAAKNPQWVVYGERTLGADPNIRRRTDEPFSQLDYAIYLGDQPTTDHLLGASVRNLPITGRTAQQAVAFGDSNLLLVMTPIGHLSGDLFANLWWIVACGGVLLSAAFALLTRRLLDRHDTALELATDNERLYDEQRHIAETLQLGLLPQHLVGPEGVSVAARYWPAGSANLIGGDFYDLFAVDDRAVGPGDRRRVRQGHRSRRAHRAGPPYAASRRPPLDVADRSVARGASSPPRPPTGHVLHGVLRVHLTAGHRFVACRAVARRAPSAATSPP